MALNRKKPFAEVCGTGFPYRYEQDNKYFDAQGNEVTESGKPITGGKASAETQAEVARTTTPPAASDNKEAGPVPETEIDAVSGNDVQTPSPEELDNLKVDEIKNMLDAMDVRYRANMPKADLLAMLKDEIQQREIEKGQDDSEGEGE